MPAPGNKINILSGFSGWLFFIKKKQSKKNQLVSRFR